MSIIDICIIIFVLFGGYLGYKQGLITTLVNLIGYILIIILSFTFKDPVSEFLMLHLPFFDFFGLIKGVSVINIAVYEIMAFGLVFSILTIALKIVLMATGILERLVSVFGLLNLPFKIIAFFIGLLRNYVIVFAVLFILSLPNFADNNFIKNSSLKHEILENTPVLTNFAENSLKVFNEFALLKEKYSESETNEFNYETLELFLRYDVIDTELVKKLVDSDKLHIKGVETLIEKYGE